MVEQFIDEYGRKKLEKEFEQSNLFKEVLKEKHNIDNKEQLDYDWTFDAKDNYIYPFFIEYIEDKYYNKIYEDDNSDYYYESQRDRDF